MIGTSSMQQQRVTPYDALTRDEKIGIHILILRRRAGMSQRKLAEQIHVDPSMVSYWENGEVPVKASMLEAIATALGGRQEELLP